MTDYGSPDNQDLIAQAIESALLNGHHALPGIVQSYDDETKTCSVQPAVTRPLPVEDGTTVYEQLPIIQNVPVAVLGCPAISIEFELVKGDTVWLVFADYSFAAWRGNGQVSDPPDLRKSGPGYPIAIPWFRPNGKASTDEKSTIGKAGGVRLHFKSGTIEVGNGSDFVAMAQKTDARLTALENWANSTTFPTGVGPTGTTLTPLTPGSSTASANLKAD